MWCSKIWFLEYAFSDSSFLKIHLSLLSLKNQIRGVISSAWSFPLSLGLHVKYSLFAKTNYHPCLDTLRFFLQVFSSLSHLSNRLHELFIVPILQASFFFIKFDHNNSYYPSHGSFMSLLQCHYMERFQSRNIKDANQFP